MSNIKFWSDCYYYRGPGQELLTDVIDTWKYIAVIRADEGCYRLFEQQRMECIPPSSLISIYDQFDSFQFMPIDSFEVGIPFHSFS